MLWITQFSVTDIFLVAEIETVREALKCAVSVFFRWFTEQFEEEAGVQFICEVLRTER